MDLRPGDKRLILLVVLERGSVNGGSKVYKLSSHGGAQVDVSSVKLLCDVLRPRLAAAHVSLDVPDLREIDSICGPAATSAGLREWMERLRVWEQEQASVTGEGDDRSRV